MTFLRNLNVNGYWRLRPKKMTAAGDTATTRPLFQKQQYDAIAELIGQKVVYGMMDDEDYRLIEVFSEMFAQDNPTTFDKVRFRDAVYDAHTRKKKSSSNIYNSTTV
jgi:hypothetical protein